MNSRRSFVKTTALAGCGAMLLPTLMQSCKVNNALMINDVKTGPFKMTTIRNGIGYFTEKGGTIGWMVNKDASLVIDTQFPEQASHLLEEIKKYKQTPLDLLINTHHHGDHTGGNIVFKDSLKRHIAHTNAKDNLINVSTKANNLDKQLIPTETFSDKMSINIGNEKLNFHYFGAGHTNGDAIIQFEKSNIVHMGDLVFNRRFPYIDKSAGADIANWIKVLEKTTSTFEKDTNYIFGHAGDDYEVLGTAADINAFKNYLESLLAFTSKSIKAGISLEDLKKTTTIIPGAEEWKGAGIERSLDAAYQELGA